MSMKFIDIESLRLCGIFPVGKEPSIRTLRSWTKWGILPHYKVGHFVYYDEKEVSEYFGLKFRASVVDIHKLRARSDKAYAALTAERDQLRAENERLRSDRDCEKRIRKDAEELREDAIARVEKADAELATEKARLDWVFRNCKVMADDYTTGNRDVYAIHDREDLGSAMKEDAQ